MSDQITYRELLRRHARIQVPIIQRDYAQGRSSEVDVRQEFLRTLRSALCGSLSERASPLNLDFIYGSVEGEHETRFNPLDGQQRLTTLFLLHWYLAWNEKCWSQFREMFLDGDRSRFSYSVRPSSNEFFDSLVKFEPTQEPKNIQFLSVLIKNQRWYFRNWRLDPTIQSVITMLDAIHSCFAGKQGLFDRLVDEADPAITFQLLDLENFGLSDDLYIKMNARGKPLTPFETFKARYEQVISKQFTGRTRNIGDQHFSIADYVARRLDTTWADLFWAYRKPKAYVCDDMVMNVFRMVALISRDPNDKNYQADVLLLRNSRGCPSISVFCAKGWLDESFTLTLISLLDSLSASSAEEGGLLKESRYFDVGASFRRLCSAFSKFSFSDIVIFTGFALFVREYEGVIDCVQFQEWMRIVRNLALNSYIERVEELYSTTKGVHELLPCATQIVEHMSKQTGAIRVSGFSEQQVGEEVIKSRLILAHPKWRPLIDRAEQHGYFRGQIEFLCEFSGVIEKLKSIEVAAWDEDTHSGFQRQFENYLVKAESMFSGTGLIDFGDFRWQRALLTFGNYLMRLKRNMCFLVDAQSEPVSWKRYLRGGVPEAVERRMLLKMLWDRLEVTEPLVEQLDSIIEQSSGMDDWIEALVRNPEAIDYCRSRFIRWISDKEVYLLAKSQMNGAHVELFSYCFYRGSLQQMQAKGELGRLRLLDYVAVNGTDDEPFFELKFSAGNLCAVFPVQFVRGRYRLKYCKSDQEDSGKVESVLIDSAGFVRGGSSVFKLVAADSIASAIVDLSELLSELPLRIND